MIDRISLGGKNKGILFKNFDVRLNTKTGKWDVVVDSGSLGIYINVDKGYEIPEVLGRIVFKNSHQSRYYPRFVGSYQDLDMSIVDHCWELHPAKTVNYIINIEIPVENQAKSITVHNLNVSKGVKGLPGSIGLNIDAANGPKRDISFENSNLSSIELLFLTGLDLSNKTLKDFPGVNARCLTSVMSCTVTGESDLIFKRSVIKHTRGLEDWTLEKDGVLEWSGTDSEVADLHCQNLTDLNGIIKCLDAGRTGSVKNIFINDLPQIRHARYVLSYCYDKVYNTQMKEDAGIEYLKLSLYDSYNRKSYIIPTRLSFYNTELQTRVLDLDLDISTRNLSTMKSSCETLYLNGSRHLKQELLNLLQTTEDSADGVVLDWYNAGLMPNLTKVYFWTGETRRYEYVVFERISGTQNKWSVQMTDSADPVKTVATKKLKI